MKNQTRVVAPKRHEIPTIKFYSGTTLGLYVSAASGVFGIVTQRNAWWELSNSHGNSHALGDGFMANGVQKTDICVQGSDKWKIGIRATSRAVIGICLGYHSALVYGLLQNWDGYR